MKDIMGIMKQRQANADAHAGGAGRTRTARVEGQSGGGLVRVTLSAKGAMKQSLSTRRCSKPTKRDRRRSHYCCLR